MKHMEQWLSAYLDGELTPAERQVLETQLANDSQLRAQLEQMQALDNVVRAELAPPCLDVEQFLTRFDQTKLTPIEDRPTRIATTHSSKWLRRGLATLLAAAMLLMVGIWVRSGKEGNDVVAKATMAQLVRVVGTVEVRSHQNASWKSWTNSTPLSLDPGTAIRTTEDSLCEIVTQESATLRMNRDTEVIMQCSDEVELIRGELWCHAGAEPVRVQADQSLASSVPNATLPEFTCPQGIHTQLKIEQNALRFGCVSDVATKVKLPGRDELSMSPGDWVASSFTSSPLAKGRLDRLQETAWQLPLLVLRPTEDQELQSLLHSMLVHLGETKIQYFYEDQIRELGAPGTLPLLAFVKAERSRTDPAVRERAMRIIADLAPESTREDLIQLCSDSDRRIAEYARLGLQRLDELLK